MSLDVQLARYNLDARARGYSEATISHTERCVHSFAAFSGGIGDVAAVVGDDLRRFILNLKDRTSRHNSSQEGLSPFSVNTYVRAVRAFWGWLEKTGAITSNPLAHVPAPRCPRKIARVYSEEQLKSLLRYVAPRPRTRAIIELFLDSGIRLSELTGLRVDDVDLTHGSVRVLGKGGKERYSYFSPMTALSLRDYLDKARPQPREGEYLFLTNTGFRLDKKGVQTSLGRLGRAAGLGIRLALHKLRHTYATLCLKNGNNLEYVRITLGHTNIKTTSSAYLNVDSTDVKAAHEKFSPLSNLTSTSTGEILGLQSKLQLEDQPKKPKERSEPGADESTPSVQIQSSSMKRNSAKKYDMNTLEDETVGAIEKPDQGYRLRPIYRELYKEHLRKLAVLVGELATDIENASLEQTRHPPRTKPGSLFAGIDLVRVYHAQNSRLWPFLSQHLDNEFVTSKLTTQIDKIAVDSFYTRIFKKEIRESELAKAVREKLVMVSERGTFEETCSICRNYFYDFGSRLLHPV